MDREVGVRGRWADPGADDEGTVPRGVRLAQRDDEDGNGSPGWFYGGHSGPLGLADASPERQAELRRLEHDFLSPSATEPWRPSWERDEDTARRWDGAPERSAWRAWLEDPAGEEPAPEQQREDWTAPEPTAWRTGAWLGTEHETAAGDRAWRDDDRWTPTAAVQDTAAWPAPATDTARHGDDRWTPAAPAQDTAWPDDRWTPTGPLQDTAWRDDRWTPAASTGWQGHDQGGAAARPVDDGWGVAVLERGDGWADAPVIGPEPDDEPELVHGLHRERARSPRGAIRTGWGHPVLVAAAAPLPAAPRPAAPRPTAAPRRATSAEPWDDWEPLDEVAGRRARHVAAGGTVLTRRVAATGTVVVTSLGLAVGAWSAWVYVVLAGVGGAAAYCLTRRSLR